MKQANLRPIANQMRSWLLSRNMYNPDNVYDINKNIVSETLNNLQEFGFDARSSVALSQLERVVQNTPLSNIGYQRLGIEMARRATDNITNDIVSSIHIGALFDGNPETKLFQRPEDFTITPSLNNGKLNFSNLADKLLGANTFSNPLSKDATNKELFDNLGSGQKNLLLYNVNQNFYNNYNFKIESGFDDASGKKNILTFLYDKTFVQELVKNQSNSGENIYEDAFHYVRDINVNPKPTKIGTKTLTLEEQLLNDTLTNRDFTNGESFNKIEGFGSTTKNNLNEYNAIYSTDQDFKYGETALNEDIGFNEALVGDYFDIKRGLLYYTHNIAKLKESMDQTKTSFGIQSNGRTLYRGTECRSFTINSKYGEDASTLIRHESNGDLNSVLGKGGRLRIHPVEDDFKNNQYKNESNYLFSIENLAYNTSEWSQLPLMEKGKNGGRMMWFAPYDMKISENTKSDWQGEKMIGRIEPIYTYAGIERSASITFMLIIDTPPTVNDYEKFDLAKYFAGCNVQQKASDDVKTKKAGEIKTVNDIPVVKADNPSNVRKNLDNTPLYFYFENDSDLFDITYEENSNGKNVGDNKNLYSLNESFNTNVDDLNTFLSSEDGKDIVISFEANASKLAKQEYNLQLSLRRGYALAKYFVFENGLTMGDDFNGFLNSTSYNKPKTGKSTSFKSNDNKNLTINITGFGEPDGNGECDNDNALRSQTDSLSAKKQRYCEISISYLPNDAVTTSNVNDVGQDTTAVIDNNALSSQNVDINDPSYKYLNQKDAFNKTYGENGDNNINPLGFDGVDYFKPVFHSQTPFDLWKRYTFLNQCMRPGSTIEKTTSNIGTNSIFGKMPVCVLRIGDFFHTKMLINSLAFDMIDTTWDLNPEGMGVQPMIIKVSMDITMIGGQSMQFPIDKLQNAIDQNFTANSTFNPKSGKFKKYYDPLTQFRDSTNNNAEFISNNKDVIQKPMYVESLQSIISNSDKSIRK